ncbi:alginate export family protein [Sphingomonas sp. RHCKR7]|uniref:alginate export family protein n=1 Tax=Sphingomonas folli TaxID=2862497 RepID=UPI001C673522|nr:alginate export family protein [Sphingomonas folli]MBW6526353.1 alginate export family protein [Sphingomonas folli]
MTHASRLLALAALLAGTGTAAAQSLPASPASSVEKPGKEETAPKEDSSGLIVTASSRLRYETVDGRPRPDEATAEDAVLLRTGVAIEYGPGPLAIGAELIDSRGYDLGSGTQIGRDDVNALELPQAYLKWRVDDTPGIGGRLAVQAGRFLLNLGSGRLVATDEYRNTVNGFTGIQVEVDPDRERALTLFYVLPQERLPDVAAEIRRNKVQLDRETFRDVLFGAWARRKGLFGGAQLELGVYRLVERDSPGRSTADRHLTTLDLRVVREPAARVIDYDAEGAYQVGRASASTMADARNARVAAGFAHLAVGYTFDAAWKPRLALFYDYASGDRDGGRFNRFDTLFGSRRDDLGPSGTYSGVARENLSAPGVRLDAKPGKRVELLADYRGLWLASRTDRFFNVTDATGGSGRFAGQQLSGRARLWLVPEHLRLESNFALLFKGGFLKDAPAALARDRDQVRLFEVNLQATF